mmetsp:Transcript_28888/g.69145  ORF Transcript_28888/g.69145 Transcript_28888/m.69145 type:complete len:303 (+) Transcript_28888:204-1112(+)
MAVEEILELHQLVCLVATLEHLIVLKVKRILLTCRRVLVPGDGSHVTSQPSAAEPRHTPPHEVLSADLDPLVHDFSPADLHSAAGVVGAGAAVNLAEKRLETVEALLSKAGEFGAADKLREGSRRHRLVQRLAAVGKHAQPLAADLRRYPPPQLLEDLEGDGEVCALVRLDVDEAEEFEAHPPRRVMLLRVLPLSVGSSALEEEHLVHHHLHHPESVDCFDEVRASHSEHRNLALACPLVVARMVPRGCVPLGRRSHTVAPEVEEKKVQKQPTRHSALVLSCVRPCRELRTAHLNDLLHVRP